MERGLCEGEDRERKRDRSEEKRMEKGSEQGDLIDVG